MKDTCNEEIPIGQTLDSYNGVGVFNYDDKVYIIKNDDECEPVFIQTGGIACHHKFLTGYICDKFETKSKWFNPEWWYKRTAWGEEFPNKIYFRDGEFHDEPLSFSNYDEETWKKHWKFINEEATKYARPVDNILKAMLKNVRKHTGKDYSLAFDTKTYGVNWEEAYIPLELHGETKYILTWENCD